MTEELDPVELRALRRKVRLATLEALRFHGGQATRSEVREHALEHGGFSDRERGAPPPEKAAHKHTSRLACELSWALTNLRRDRLVTNPVRSVWALANEAAKAPTMIAAPVLGSRLEQLRAMPYREYLRTPEWRETRAAALVRAGFSCQMDIEHTENLEVHHRTYERRGEERAEDLTVLCGTCHGLHHRHAGRPGRRAPRADSVAPPIVADVRRAVPSTPPRSLLARLLGR